MVGRDAPEHDPEPLRILVLGGDPESIAFMRFWLTYAGIAVAFAEDGLHALGEIRRFRPDLVLLDHSLPGADSAEIVERLRQDPELLILVLMAGGQTHDHNGHLNGDSKRLELSEIEELMRHIDTVVRRRVPTHADCRATCTVP